MYLMASVTPQDCPSKVKVSADAVLDEVVQLGDEKRQYEKARGLRAHEWTRLCRVGRTGQLDCRASCTGRRAEACKSEICLGRR